MTVITIDFVCNFNLQNSADTLLGHVVNWLGILGKGGIEATYLPCCHLQYYHFSWSVSTMVSSFLSQRRLFLHLLTNEWIKSAFSTLLFSRFFSTFDSFAVLGFLREKYFIMTSYEYQFLLILRFDIPLCYHINYYVYKQATQLSIYYLMQHVSIFKILSV
jgi:hypothetical protein